ncbi:MAG: MBL fold metallo-hydrolase [Phycisphaerales bacterium]|nr:MBL fold metallo-hydrolase [Phycisphaerales bacterium]
MAHVDVQGVLGCASTRRSLLAAGAGLAGAAMLPRLASAQPSKPAPSTPDAAKTLPAPAATPAPKQGFHAFTIGSIQAMAIHDGASSFAPVHPMFAPEATVDELNAVLRDHFHPLDKAPIEFNVLALKMGAETILIDTGFGPGQDGVGKTVQNLRAAGIAPESVTGIVITHAHGDHFHGLLNADDSLTYPNAKVFVSRKEHDFWTGATPDLGETALDAKTKAAWIARGQAIFKKIQPKLQLVSPADKLVSGLEFVDTAGHTPGHMSVIVTSGSDSVVVAGDIMHNRVAMLANPRWTFSLDVNKKDAVKSRIAMFERIAGERLRVFAYHLPWPGLGNIRKQGAGFEWMIEPWAW